MITLGSIDDVRNWRDSLPRSARVGFTPTMGALHDGHLEHLRRLEPLVDVRICSIFVNPTQFAAGEDLERYPRNLEADSELLRDVGCDALFFPGEVEMYPAGYSTWVEVSGISERFEGAHRPEHFRGVSTIVCKLLNIVDPDVMTLGEKDAQQLRLIERMVEDLNLGVEIMPIPIVREADGLAMSSRNRYLSGEEHQRALALSRGLLKAHDCLAEGGDIAGAIGVMREELEDRVEVDYCEIIDRLSFDLPTDVSTELIGIVAGRVGTTRLIDNMRMPKPIHQAEN